MCSSMNILSLIHIYAGAKQRGGRAVEQDAPVAGEGRERRAEAIGQRVRGVDEDQRAAVNLSLIHI